jgi:sugar fermentation stimulation protein A
MYYTKIKPAKFICRPNRFIAHIEIDNRIEICHVKNTGRLKEILIPGTKIFVQEINSKTRKTKYDLISAYKGHRLINIDSQVPNRVFHEWLETTGLIEKISLIKAESKYENSRFDFYVETTDKRKIFVEIKGVTLEINNVALFPDAPTGRGVKHILELCKSLEEGFEAYIVFIVQMKDVLYFTPNKKTHKEFYDVLKIAYNKGVKVFAIDTKITRNSITARDFVSVKF